MWSSDGLKIPIIVSVVAGWLSLVHVQKTWPSDFCYCHNAYLCTEKYLSSCFLSAYKNSWMKNKSGKNCHEGGKALWFCKVFHRPEFLGLINRHFVCTILVVWNQKNLWGLFLSEDLPRTLFYCPGVIMVRFSFYLESDQHGPWNFVKVFDCWEKTFLINSSRLTAYFLFDTRKLVQVRHSRRSLF